MCGAATLVFLALPGCSATEDLDDAIPSIIVSSGDLPGGSNEAVPGALAVFEDCITLDADGATYPIVWDPGTTMGDAHTVLFQGVSPIAVDQPLPNAVGRVVPASTLPDSVIGLERCTGSPNDLVLILQEEVDPTLVGQ